MSLGDLKVAFQAAQLRLTQALDRHAKTQGMEWPFFVRPTWDAVVVAEADYDQAARKLAQAVVLEETATVEPLTGVDRVFAEAHRAEQARRPRPDSASPAIASDEELARQFWQRFYALSPFQDNRPHEDVTIPLVLDLIGEVRCHALEQRSEPARAATPDEHTCYVPGCQAERAALKAGVSELTKLAKDWQETSHAWQAHAKPGGTK